MNKGSEHMARIKWIKNDVSLERGNYLAVVVKFDNSKVWLRPAAMMTAREDTINDALKVLRQCVKKEC